MVLILSGIFYKPLSKKILELRGLKRKDKELELLFREEKESIALPEPGSSVITTDDVVHQFSRIAWFNPDDIRSSQDRLRGVLVLNGVVTMNQLKELVGSTQVQNTLTALYIKHLDRETSSPFDPTALATYGPPLLLYKDKDDVARQIAVALVLSPEYKQKQLRRKASGGKIIGEQRGDYFHIICSNCGEHVNSIYKGLDPVMPFFKYQCPKCGNNGSLKLMGMRWKGLSRRPE
jgi:predicted nucleic-acid-binding Zn-ribbon protein